MKSRFLLLLIVYLTLLLIIAGQYDTCKQSLNVENFGRSINESMRLLFSYVAISFFSSSLFIIASYLLYNQTISVSILLMHIMNIFTCVTEGVVSCFILWITQLNEAVGIFYKTFMIATISTISTTIWMLRIDFKVKPSL